MICPIHNTLQTNVTSDKQILLINPVTLAEFDVFVVIVSVASFASDSEFLCLSQQSPYKKVQLESFLTTVDDNGLFKICVRNILLLPVKLKSRVLLGNALPLSENIKVLDDFPAVK